MKKMDKENQSMAKPTYGKTDWDKEIKEIQNAMEQAKENQETLRFDRVASCSCGLHLPEQSSGTGMITDKEIALEQIYDLEKQNKALQSALWQIYDIAKQTYSPAEKTFHDPTVHNISLNKVQEQERNKDFRVWRRDERMPAMAQFRTDIPVVIFADGWGLTSDHENYHMSRFYRTRGSQRKAANEALMCIDCAQDASNEVPVQLSIASERMVHAINTDAITYTATDETSFIFLNPHDLINFFELREETYEDYVCSLFAETFLKYTRKQFPRARFSVSLFYVRKEDIPSYIGLRGNVCHHTAMQYMAKEYLSPRLYHGLETEDLRNLLRKYGLWNPLVSDKPFYEGIEKYYKKIVPPVLNPYDAV